MSGSPITRRHFVGSSLIAPLLGTVRPTSRAIADELDDGVEEGSKTKAF